MAKQSAAFVQVKRELHACANIKFGLRYPATLHITMSSGQTYRFEDPDQALEFVNMDSKIQHRSLNRFVFLRQAAYPAGVTPMLCRCCLAYRLNTVLTVY